MGVVVDPTVLKPLRLAAQKQRIDTITMLTDAGVVDVAGTALSYSASDGLETSSKFLLHRQQQQQTRKTMGGVAYVRTRVTLAA